MSLNNDFQGSVREKKVNNIRKPTDSTKCNIIKPLINPYMKKHPTWKENVKNYFSEYCNLSGIHGVRYLGERGRFIIEKLIWAITLIIMCYFCITLILKSYSKWVSSPVIVSFATLETPIWEIPFPAVTICPVVKSDPDIFNYSNVFLKKYADLDITPQESDAFEIMSLICSAPNPIEIIYNGSQTINWNAIANVFNAAPPAIFIEEGSWLGSQLDKDMFSIVYTTKGLCYSFNIVDPNELRTYPVEYRSENYKKSKRWSVEHGYLNNKKAGEFPRRTFVTGNEGGLTVQLFTNSNHIDLHCVNDFQGFEVAIHHPSEFPNMDASFRLPLDQIVSVAVRPKMIIVSEQLKQYKPEVRNCYFSNERPLRYFHYYSQKNCLEECFTNFSIKQCGCVAFYMPKSRSCPICSPANMDCIVLSRVRYLLSYLNQSSDKCDCLPSCTALEYKVEISQAVWDWRKVALLLKRLVADKHTEAFIDLYECRFSKLVVYFKEMQFLALERRELYGSMDFFSNTGGLLGLFIGFSVTSAIEILYFLTLRVVCNIRKFGRNFWSRAIEIYIFGKVDHIGSSQKTLWRKKFYSNKEVVEAVRKWVRLQPKDCFPRGIGKLPKAKS